jgi:hypothetical protein
MKDFAFGRSPRLPNAISSGKSDTSLTKTKIGRLGQKIARWITRP